MGERLYRRGRRPTTCARKTSFLLRMYQHSTTMFPAAIPSLTRGILLQVLTVRHSRHARSTSKRCGIHALIEALDRRTLLSVAFKFNIVDPTNTYAAIKPQLQGLLDAAGADWAQYIDIQHDVTLEYDVNFSKETP